MSALSGLVTINLFGIFLEDPRPGLCPDVETMPNFDMPWFDGQWFEAMRNFTPTESHGKCVKAVYVPYNQTALQFRHTEIDTRTGKPLAFGGNLFQPDPNEPGKLKMVFSEMPITVDYWILGTDYNTYAAIYSCKEDESSYEQYAWILTRAQHPPESVVEDALNVFDLDHVDTKSFIRTDQEHCPEWGE